MQRVEQVSSLPGRADGANSPNPAAPRGHELIVPERSNVSFHWIAQTQQMLSRGEWRVRHVDYDNAPFGREVLSPSPYRWWLGLVAWIDRSLFNHSPGLALERAALAADPILHVLLLLGATLYVGRNFGFRAAALLALAIAALFPFAAGFLPGAPSHRALALVAALGSVLPLIGGFRSIMSTTDSPRPAVARGNFMAAGIMGGLGLWIDALLQGPLLAGVAAGAIGAAWARRGSAVATSPPPPWRIWAWTGAATLLVGYTLEFFPTHLAWSRTHTLHPLWALTWWGGGELLARIVSWIRGARPAWTPRTVALTCPALLAVVALPLVALLAPDRSIGAPDPLAERLTALPEGVVAKHSLNWIARDGFTAAVVATALPVALLGLSIWLLARRRTAPDHRAILALALGPACVALVFALVDLRWWAPFGCTLLVVIVATGIVGSLMPAPARPSWWWPALVGIALAPGVIQLLPRLTGEGGGFLTRLDGESLVERDLANWLAKRVGEREAIVLAPPALTTTLFFHGGLRGVATFAPENEEGMEAALLLASNVAMDEVRELIGQRRITHLVVPSWDRYLDALAHAGSSQPENTLISRLRSWTQPFWLRPIPYHLPAIAGFEGESVVVFEVIEAPDEAAGLSQLAEYFIEMGQLNMAGSMGEALSDFPADLNALLARAQIAAAYNDAIGQAEAMEVLVPLVSAGVAEYLPWDRSVSLAAVLAQAKRHDLAREQAARCVGEATEERIRSLSTASLFRLSMLAAAFDLPFNDPQLRAVALDLLPEALRRRLPPASPTASSRASRP